MGAIALSAIAIASTSKSEFRIIPAGKFKAVDGRPDGGMWSMSAAVGKRMVSEARARAIDYVIDYEHQTLNSASNGKPAPAAGWFKNLDWRSDGLYLTDARWTAKAKAMIDAGEYRFISPVFAWDKATFEVSKLISIALVNEPGLHGLTDLSALRLETSSVPSAPAVDMTPQQREYFSQCFGVDAETATTSSAVDTAMTERDAEVMAKVFQDASWLTR